MKTLTRIRSKFCAFKDAVAVAPHSLKEQHELAISNALLVAIRQKADFLRLGVAGVEPDVIYRIAERIVGIEVATAYYDDTQAKTEWELARGNLKPHPSGVTHIGGWHEPDALIAAQVQQELDDKCAKTYTGTDSTWLCIEQHAPLSDVAVTLDVVGQLKVPQKHSFTRIYLGSYAPIGDGGGFRAYEVVV